MVHKEVACKYSPVWKSAFNSPLIEGQTHTYTLDDVPEHIFRLLVQWLYSQKIKLLSHPELLDPQARAKASTKEPCRGPVRCTDEHLELVTLWILGDRLLMDVFQNFVMDVLIAKFYVCGASLGLHAFIYENTLPGSALRHLLVAENVWLLGIFHMESVIASVPREMLIDMAQALQVGMPHVGIGRIEAGSMPELENLYFYVDRDSCKRSENHGLGEISPGFDWAEAYRVQTRSHLLGLPESTRSYVNIRRKQVGDFATPNFEYLTILQNSKLGVMYVYIGGQHDGPHHKMSDIAALSQ